MLQLVVEILMIYTICLKCLASYMNKTSLCTQYCKLCNIVSLGETILDNHRYILLCSLVSSSNLGKELYQKKLGVM